MNRKFTAEKRASRFWLKVEKTHSCWIWTGSKTATGYGEAWTGQKKIPAHRFSFLLSGGEIPAGMVLDHLCRNRICVNPWHLEPVSIAENVRRGTGSSSASSVKARTHCPKGHEYTDSNTLRRSNRGGRDCRACRDDRARTRYESRNPNAKSSRRRKKLSKSEVAAVFDALNLGMSNKDAAQNFRLDLSTVSAIKNKKHPRQIA